MIENLPVVSFCLNKKIFSFFFNFANMWLDLPTTPFSYVSSSYEI